MYLSKMKMSDFEAKIHNNSSFFKGTCRCVVIMHNYPREWWQHDYDMDSFFSSRVTIIKMVWKNLATVIIITRIWKWDIFYLLSSISKKYIWPKTSSRIMSQVIHNIFKRSYFLKRTNFYYNISLTLHYHVISISNIINNHSAVMHTHIVTGYRTRQ